MSAREVEQEPSGAAVGRGALVIGAAKAWFVVAGFVVQFALPRVLADAAAYGVYGLALSAISVVNNVLIAATVQTVSKLVSESEARSDATLRRVLGLQALLGAALAGFVVWTGKGAGSRYEDPQLERLLVVASSIVVSYALYATVVGTWNGRQRFVTQARFDGAFTTMRSVGILAGAATAGALGAVAGFAAAAVLIAAASLVHTGTGRAGEAAPVSRVLSVMAPTWLFQFGLNGLLQLDGWVLKNELTARAASLGIAADAITAEVNTACGYYKGAQNFAFVPYQLVLTVALVVFPMISKATTSGDLDAARVAIRSGSRFSLLAAMLLAAPLAGAANGVMTLIYPAEYGAAGPALAALALGIVAFVLMSLACTVVASSGRPLEAAVVTLPGFAAMLVLDTAAVRTASSPADALVRVSIGTSLAMVLAAIVGVLRVRQLFGTFVAPVTVLRGLAAGGLGYSVAHAIATGGKVRTLLGLVAGALVYGLALLLTGELSDLRAFVAARRAARSSGRD